MVRRMTPSRYASWVRQQQQKQDQAIRRHNQEVDRVNRANKAAADKFVRDYHREVDRVNHHNKRVVDDHNRRARQSNQNTRAAVAKYNQAVRTYNIQVERDRQRRLTALRSNTTTRYVEVRNSTIELSQRFDRVEHSGGAAGYADLLALSEREASNSAAVAEALLADEPEGVESAEDTGILEYLAGFSKDLCAVGAAHYFPSTPATRTQHATSAPA